jgi:hypothetical protein
MSRDKKSPYGNKVDWSKADLQALLDKTEGWGLDNRGVYSPLACELHIGWGASTGRGATLVYEREGVMVVETTFAIPKGEHVRVDRFQFGSTRSTWCIVIDGREGFRAEDRDNGIFVHWLHVR